MKRFEFTTKKEQYDAFNDYLTVTLSGRGIIKRIVKCLIPLNERQEIVESRGFEHLEDAKLLVEKIEDAIACGGQTVINNTVESVYLVEGAPEDKDLCTGNYPYHVVINHYTTDLPKAKSRTERPFYRTCMIEDLL